METLRFDGRVLPTVVQVTIQDHPVINWNSPDENLNLTVKISIQQSMISVECETAKYDPNKLPHIYNRAFDLSRAAVDLIAFQTGYGLTVIFEKLILPSGEVTEFLSSDPTVAALCTAYSTTFPSDLQNNSFDQALRIVSSDWRIAHVLRWLAEGLSIPHVHPTNGARAIEGIRNLIAPAGMPRGQAWREMRKVLNVSEDFLRYVTNFSTGPRHGEHGHIPGAETAEIYRRSWTIFNRFLEFKKRGDQSLPLSEFPML